jgi:glyoxylase-like metal-dependent hydrolase (beta-lactamase superfamily II)
VDHCESRAGLTRRSVVTGGATLGLPAVGGVSLGGASLGLGTALTGWPAAAARAAQALPLGDGELLIVSDGNLTLGSPQFLAPDQPLAEIEALLAGAGLPTDTVLPPLNITLFRDDSRVVLFDAGSGPNFQPSAGALIANLEVAGIDPSDVTDVLLTHAHPDHIWGVLDDFDELAFPEATYWIGITEHDAWRDPGMKASLPPERESFVIGALNRFEAIEDRMERFKVGDEVLPGIEAVASFGHTPGHVCFSVRNGTEEVMVLGDAIAHPVVPFAHPDWHSQMDQDREMGAQTRKTLMDRLATDKVRIIGYHLTDGGVGYVERDGAAYRFVAS